ncbi:hypothetical protein CC1G_05968 [Coprinopsis cinerea okayama7|uniref:Uncharacterized protein n=1 Tax=Coprinopsis cinerea (strain Okayama-7 / 130 / ATCC MYA-4618 / FGSC 9003) TaxID=240176 RepID=A8N4J0_COPC7|nr:hypothetical protein CC1G_05968 [Coprinopsis cinerea okayama7\|eukprot:XP_001829759.2 hypothetical protein CC1G_05968 [Coprinopsis cinerea okayama7\
MVNTPTTPTRNKFGVDPRDKSALHELLLKTYATAPPRVEREVEDFLIEVGFLRPRIKTPSPKVVLQKPRGSLIINPFKLRRAVQELPAKTSASTTSEVSKSTSTPSKAKSSNLFKSFALPKRRKTTDSATRAPKLSTTPAKPVRAYTTPASPRSRAVVPRRRSHNATTLTRTITKPRSPSEHGVTGAQSGLKIKGPIEDSDIGKMSPKPIGPRRLSKVENLAQEEEQNQRYEEALAAFKIYIPKSPTAPPPFAPSKFSHTRPVIRNTQVSSLSGTERKGSLAVVELKDQGTIKPAPLATGGYNSINGKVATYLKRTTLVVSILVLTIVTLFVAARCRTGPVELR